MSSTYSCISCLLVSPSSCHNIKHLHACISADRYPISIAKALVQEGNDTWFSISKGSRQVLWKEAIFEIEQKFMKISRGTTRSLTAQVIHQSLIVASLPYLLTLKSLSRDLSFSLQNHVQTEIFSDFSV